MSIKISMYWVRLQYIYICIHMYPIVSGWYSHRMVGVTTPFGQIPMFGHTQISSQVVSAYIIYPMTIPRYLHQKIDLNRHIPTLRARADAAIEGDHVGFDPDLNCRWLREESIHLPPSTYIPTCVCVSYIYIYTYIYYIHSIPLQLQ